MGTLTYRGAGGEVEWTEKADEWPRRQVKGVSDRSPVSNTVGKRRTKK